MDILQFCKLKTISIEAAMELQAEFDESQHPRDKGGKFTAGEWDGKAETKDFYKGSDRAYKRSRYEAVHKPLIEKYEHKESVEHPKVTIIGGGTASGKSRLADEARAGIPEPAGINTDDFRAGLPEAAQLLGTDKLGLLHEEASDVRDRALEEARVNRNHIVLDAPGSQSLADKVDGLEKGGYGVNYVYAHRPIDESIMMAENRVRTTTNPADKRIVPEPTIRASHAKARDAFSRLAAQGRDVKVYDGSGKGRNEPYDLVYHRTADGTVEHIDQDRMQKIASSENPPLVGW